MEITVDLSKLESLNVVSPAKIIWFIFSHGGWLILIIAIFYFLFYLRLFLKRKKYVAAVKQTLLTIDIPKDNEQSLLAVVQIFATLAGIKISLNLIEKYWLGKVQLWFSLEIISLEGYIQFLIRTPTDYRDLVEAAIYAQYPEAEITEVEDYVSLIPNDVYRSSSEFKLWATEFILNKDSCYPIKTFKFFEYPLSQTFIDPMASLLEVMSKLGRGEQIGLQLLIRPTNDDWKEKGYQIIRHLVGEKGEPPQHFGDKIVNVSVKSLEKFSEAVIKLWGDIKEEKVKPGQPNLMQFLTPGERFVLENIQTKLAQICFATKFRIYYLAHQEVFLKGRGVNALIGAINQFNTTNLNAFKKDKRRVTDVNYFFIKARIALRQKKFVKNYKNRVMRKGSTPFMLSLEELATLYHFPTITVKAPLLKRTEAKKAEPPVALPIEPQIGKSFFKPIITLPPKTAAAEERFTISESLSGYDFDNDYFERKFSKDKTAIKSEKVTAELAAKKNAPPNNLPIS